MGDQAAARTCNVGILGQLEWTRSAGAAFHDGRPGAVANGRQGKRAEGRKGVHQPDFAIRPWQQEGCDGERRARSERREEKRSMVKSGPNGCPGRTLEFVEQFS